ncbi:MAG TPA: cell division protein FtsA [Syntrophales bacterium]|nr:cell division protein FtsA [Syntrophales bacterium]HOL60228.1 cell division protein FtsA [Syntrophales bacterium]HPO36334.1 cell division protein FtsA [Syntrophales bacterium]
MRKKANIFVGLDIGTTKTCAIVGEWAEQGLNIVGLGTHPSEGLRKGVVVNIDSTVESIARAVEEAEHMSGCEIRSAYVSIAGQHIKSQNSLGIVAIKGREVDDEDVQRAIEASRAVAVPPDREILHALPQSYIVDDQDGVKDPVGMSGVRLEAKVHIVTGATPAIQNVVKSVNRVGINVEELVLAQIASAESVLSDDEKDLGVALFDIGGGTTDIAVFTEGSVKHTAVIPVGGQYVTNDIAQGLRTPILEAEKVKIKHGCAYVSLIPKDEMIEVPSVGGREAREVSRQLLGRIIEPRMEEILNLAFKEIVKAGFEDNLAAGIVLTGGTALTPGVVELAEQMFNLPVRCGYPGRMKGLTDVVKSPIYATAVGLILRAVSGLPPASAHGATGMVGGWIDKIKKWFVDFF